jgi:hypothetical protein
MGNERVWLIRTSAMLISALHWTVQVQTISYWEQFLFVFWRNKMASSSTVYDHQILEEKNHKPHSFGFSVPSPSLLKAFSLFVLMSEHQPNAPALQVWWLR